MTTFAEWCAGEGMPISYHHHMAAAIETEPELDLLMANSGEAQPLLFDAGHMAFAGGDVLRVIDKHHKRMIASDRVGAVIVASPDTTHAERALACLEAGKPVLCEKPLASSAVEALHVVHAEVAAQADPGRLHAPS